MVGCIAALIRGVLIRGVLIRGVQCAGLKGKYSIALFRVTRKAWVWLLRRERCMN